MRVPYASSGSSVSPLQSTGRAPFRRRSVSPAFISRDFNYSNRLKPQAMHKDTRSLDQLGLGDRRRR